VTLVEKFAELPGQIRLPYVEQGEPSGVPLVLLHGFLESWRAFELLLPHLPESTHVFAVTQRGHAGATRPRYGYRPTDFAADAAAFMDTLELEAAVITGASSGGTAAQRLAIDHPQRVLGLALLGSPVTLRDKPRVRELWDSTISKMTDPVDPDFVREFVERLPTRPLPPGFLEIMVQEGLDVPAHVWRAVNEALLQEDPSGELSKISAPTLILWGDRDDLTRGDQQTLGGAIPNSRLVVIPEAGHMAYWEQPGRVASELATFVEELGPR
jgi:non-heme chloroperoxidase